MTKWRVLLTLFCWPSAAGHEVGLSERFVYPGETSLETNNIFFMNSCQLLIVSGLGMGAYA